VAKQHEPHSLDDLLQEALAREEEARDFYAGLLTHGNLDFVKDVLETLHDEECRHVEIVRGMITRFNLEKPVI